MSIQIKGFEDIDVSIDEGRVRIEQSDSESSAVIIIAPRAVEELCQALKEAAADAIEDEEKES